MKAPQVLACGKASDIREFEQNHTLHESLRHGLKPDVDFSRDGAEGAMLSVSGPVYLRPASARMSRKDSLCVGS